MNVNINSQMAKEDQNWVARSNESLDKDSNPIKVTEPVNNFFKSIVSKRWLTGGRRETWAEVETICKEWAKNSGQYFKKKVPSQVKRISSLKELMPKWSGGALTLAFESDYYKNILPDINSFNVVDEPQANRYENYKQLATRGIQLVALARSVEVNDTKDGIVKYEYEVAEKGGWLVGFTSKNILVYFPLPVEKMMDKLLNNKDRES